MTTLLFRYKLKKECFSRGEIKGKGTIDMTDSESGERPGEATTTYLPCYLFLNEVGAGPGSETKTPPPARREASPEGYTFCNETGLGLEGR